MIKQRHRVRSQTHENGLESCSVIGTARTVGVAN
jgi:hypothetical protein